MLVVCPACNRHVRDETCPFCGASIERREKPARPRGHGTRAAIAFGTAATAVGVTLAACSDSSTTNYAPPYGAHPLGDATTGTMDGSTTMDDTGAAAPGYGGMTIVDSSATGVDAGSTDNGDASDDAADQ
jgi:hypothetical protein